MWSKVVLKLWYNDHSNDNDSDNQNDVGNGNDSDDNNDNGEDKENDFDYNDDDGIYSKITTNKVIQNKTNKTMNRETDWGKNARVIKEQEMWEKGTGFFF